MKTFKVDLSVNGMKKLAQDMDSIMSAIEQGAEDAVNELLQYGQEYARNIIYQSVGNTGYYVSTGTLADSVDTSVAAKRANGDVFGEIHAGEHIKYAAFVEFGTGVIGMGNSHPEAGIQGWEYDTNGHGEKGWYYYGADGKKHFTQGQVAVAYMYKTRQEIQRIGDKVATRCINSRLGGI